MTTRQIDSRFEQAAELKNSFKAQLIVAFLLGALSICTGCSHITGGNPIKPEAIAFLQKGTTPYSEVVASLGQPNVDLDLPNGHLVAYFWEIMKNDGITLYVLGIPVKEWDPSQRRYLFCVEFDESNILKRFETIRTFKGETIAEKTLRWQGHPEFVGGTRDSSIEDQ